jgi:hypothetical protein
MGGYPTRFWPLVLTKSARTMTIVFIVVGAIAYVGYSVTIRTAFHFNVNSIEASVAQSEVEAAYSTLATSTQTFKSATEACNIGAATESSELACLKQADRAWTQALQTYGSSISEFLYPESARADANAATASVDRAVAYLDNVAAAPDLQSYSALVTNSNFRSTLSDVDTTFNQLDRNLNDN